MSHTPHALAEEFPDHVQKISALKEHDTYFARLVEDYDAVNEKVHRSEVRLDLITEEDEEHLRKKRAALKDHIWARLKV
ncbi:MAG: DUF465 domain-containing protein [Cypionkella sp.]|nr:DUF465 domain-containing protein [Cypionkella sp.]